jgi:hypothetical protein
MNETATQIEAEEEMETDDREPFDAVPWESIDWAGIVGDVRTMRRYGWLYSDARKSIVNRFEREFERRLNRQLQGTSANGIVDTCGESISLTF